MGACWALKELTTWGNATYSKMANKINDTRYKFVNFDQIYLRKSKLQIGIVNMNIVIKHGNERESMVNISTS